MGSIKPQPKILTCWRVWLTLAMLLPAFLNALFFPSRGVWWLAITAVWVLAYLAGYVVYLPLRYRKLSYSLSGGDVRVYSGVLYTRARSLPLHNIQFTAVYRNPLDRMFGLATVVAVAAGGRISLPGLRLADAEALAEALLRSA